MDVQQFTPLVRMRYIAILRKLRDLQDDLASEYEVSPEAVFDAMSDFAQISTRVSILNGDADFTLALGTDDVKTLKKKFRAYLNTSTPELIYEMEAAIRETDAPHDEDLAPGVAPTEKKDKHDA